MSSKTKTPLTPAQQDAEALRHKQLRRAKLVKGVVRWLTSRSRDLAMVAIIVGSGIAVFDGALYSATAFGFAGVSAVAFALMPDALMVLSAAKMRQPGISPTQHATARKSMRFGLGFSLITNMIAAILRGAPEHWITPEMLFAGAVAYHGVVVLILWFATETLTKVRAGRAGAGSPVAAKPSAAKESSKPRATRSTSNTKAGKGTEPTTAPIRVPLQLAPPAQTLDRLRRGQLVMSDLK